MFFMDDSAHPSIIFLLSAAASRGVLNPFGTNKKPHKLLVQHQNDLFFLQFGSQTDARRSSPRPKCLSGLPPPLKSTPRPSFQPNPTPDPDADTSPKMV
jgi:hypothetical protein